MSPDDFSHDEHHDHDHDPKVEGDEGEWVASEPPVDDFGDEHAAGETGALEGEEGQEQSPEDMAQEKKPFPVVMVIGAVVVLAVAGGLAYWQFTKRPPQEVALLDQAAHAPQTASQEIPPSLAAQPAIQPAGPTPAVSEAPKPMPAPDAATSVAPKTGFSSPSANFDADVAKNVAPSAGMVTATATPTLPEPIPPGNVVALPPKPAPVVETVKPADANRVAELSARIDDLQKSLGQTTQELGQINQKLAVSGAGPANPDLDQRLARLEQKLTQVEQARIAPPKANFEPASLPAPHHEAVASVFPKHQKKHAASHVRHKSEHHGATSNSWVLRAATSDEAWVAKNTATRELRPVHIGDQLAGIGTVTAIRKVGDSWVVQGSHGTVR